MGVWTKLNSPQNPKLSIPVLTLLLVGTPLVHSPFNFKLRSMSPDFFSSLTQEPITRQSRKLLLDINDSGYGASPCSAGATAVLDFIAEVLSEFVPAQVKASQLIENILESVPLYIDSESVLVFQGMCLRRFINFIERPVLHDDEEDEKKVG